MLRIYTDGVYDMFHRGHLESFKEIKKLYPNCRIVVGLISDSDCESYKRVPIISQEDRFEILKAIRYIDEVIFPAPLVLTNTFIVQNNLDIIVHGFADATDKDKQTDFFKIPIEMGIFQEIPYWKNQSTSQIIQNITTRS